MALQIIFQGLSALFFLILACLFTEWFCTKLDQFIETWEFEE